MSDGEINSVLDFSTVGGGVTRGGSGVDTGDG
jgi:hypothetical protein